MFKEWQINSLTQNEEEFFNIKSVQSEWRKMMNTRLNVFQLESLKAKDTQVYTSDST